MSFSMIMIASVGHLHSKQNAKYGYHPQAWHCYYSCLLVSLLAISDKVGPPALPLTRQLLR
jgi:hypothetical protein